MEVLLSLGGVGSGGAGTKEKYTFSRINELMTQCESRVPTAVIETASKCVNGETATNNNSCCALIPENNE